MGTLRPQSDDDESASSQADRSYSESKVSQSHNSFDDAEETSLLETSLHDSLHSKGSSESSGDSAGGLREAALNAADEQFESLVAHVLKAVQITGKAFEYKKSDKKRNKLND